MKSNTIFGNHVAWLNSITIFGSHVEKINKFLYGPVKSTGMLQKFGLCRFIEDEIDIFY